MNILTRKTQSRRLYWPAISIAIICCCFSCTEDPLSVFSQTDSDQRNNDSSSDFPSESDTDLLETDTSAAKSLLVVVLSSAIDVGQYSYLKENLEGIDNSSPHVETIALQNEGQTKQALIEAVDQLISNLNETGKYELNLSDVFLLGHGDGADVVLTLASLSSYGGLITLGGKPLPNEVRESSKAPLLTLAGEFDGTVWYTQHAGAIEHAREAFQAGQTDIYSDQPIVILKGVNSGHMAGEAGWKNDLPTQLEKTEAHETISQAIRQFVQLHQSAIEPSDEEKQAARSFFLDQNEQSFALVEQFIEALSLENGSWCTLTQQAIANPKEEAQSRLQVDMLNLIEWDPFGDFKPSLKTIRDANNDKIVIVSAANFADNWDDSVTTWASARNISCKSKTQDSIKNELNADRFFGVYVQCKEANKAAFQWALDHVSQEAKSLYEQNGKSMVFLNDRKVITGIDWIAAKKPLKQSTKNPEVYEVRSTALVSDTWVPAVGGMHYCKLLSPAQAMEWILFESLK